MIDKFYKRNKYPKVLYQEWEKTPINGQQVTVIYENGAINSNVWFIKNRFRNKYGMKLYHIHAWRENT